MNKEKSTIMKAVPTAAELRKVPGFNPLTYLRPAVSKTNGEKGLKLELPYKKLWFRLACPRGRMTLNPLRITDQIAIFEARLYAEQGDDSMLANFISTKQAKDVPGGRYIRDAQDEAMNEALDNAGFGIQFCDIDPTYAGSEYGSEIPLAQLLELAQQAGQPVPNVQSSPIAKATTVPPAVEQLAVQSVDPAATPRAETPVEEKKKLHEAESEVQPVAPAPAPTSEAPVTPPVVEAAAPARDVFAEVPEKPEPVGTTADVLQMLGGTSAVVNEATAQATTAPAAQQDASPVEAVPAEPVPKQAESVLTVAPKPVVPSYTADMSVEEICARMTVEEAKAIKVDAGTCKGMTLGEVQDRRPSSLRFYVYASPYADNVLKAAATLLLNEMNQLKAG